MPFLARRTELVGRLGADLITPRELIDRKRLTLSEIAGRLHQFSDRLLARRERDLVQAAAHLRPMMVQDFVSRAELRLESLADLLESYSYERVLARGFA